MQTTDLAFTSIQVQDLDASQKFYTEVIGFQINEQVNQPGAVVFDSHSGSIFAIRTLVAESINNPGNGVALWFETKALDTLIKRVKNNGVIVSERIPTPFGDKVTLTDPDGYELTFFGQEGENN